MRVGERTLRQDFYIPPSPTRQSFFLQIIGRVLEKDIFCFNLIVNNPKTLKLAYAIENFIFRIISFDKIEH